MRRRHLISGCGNDTDFSPKMSLFAVKVSYEREFFLGGKLNGLPFLWLYGVKFTKHRKYFCAVIALLKCYPRGIHFVNMDTVGMKGVVHCKNKETFLNFLNSYNCVHQNS